MTILFMPDISGFTQFVKDVEIKHSKHIISELIQLIDEQNGKKFELAEIEGDALFYYQEEGILSGDAIINTIQRMHDAFHAHLNLYRYKRICNCGACTAAADLNLKFVLHIGETELIELNNKKKPFGAEVILLHRFLKNQIKLNEYVLFSQAIVEKFKDKIQSSLEGNLILNQEEFDGEPIEYFYIDLKRKELTKNVAASFPQLEGLDFIEENIEIKMDAATIFQYVIDLEKRVEWNKGLDDFIFDSNEINQIDSMHTCVINGKNVDIKTIYSETGLEEFIYIEETENIPLLKALITLLKIEQRGEISLVRSTAYLKPKYSIFKLILPLFKKKLSKNIKASLQALKTNISK